MSERPISADNATVLVSAALVLAIMSLWATFGEKALKAWGLL